MLPLKEASSWLRMSMTLLLLVFLQQTLAQSFLPAATSSDRPQITAPITLLSEYIKIPSETGSEIEAARFFEKQCRLKGLHIHYISDSVGSVNFAASLYPLERGKPNIVFLNHLDVVSAGDASLWEFPPYSGTIAHDKVYGRGSFDNKGLAIVHLSAIEHFTQISREKNLPYNVTLLCVSGEEIGGSTGSAIVSKNFKETFNPVVLIGEGGSGMNTIGFVPGGKTFFAISITEKSFVWLKLSCKIEAPGHASIAGKNYANAHLVNGLAQLVNMKRKVTTTEESRLMFLSFAERIGGIRGFLVEHMNWIIFKPVLKYFTGINHEMASILCNTITISAIINNNQNPNRTVQEASAILDCRLLPGTTPAEIIEQIEREINDTLISISIIRQGAPQFTTFPELYYDRLSDALQKCYTGAEVVPMLFPASSDNSYYRATGCPVYGLNPMIVTSEQIQCIHNYNEYIDFEDIDKGIEVFVEFLNGLLIYDNQKAQKKNRLNFNP